MVANLSHRVDQYLLSSQWMYFCLAMKLPKKLAASVNYEFILIEIGKIMLQFVSKSKKEKYLQL